MRYPKLNNWILVKEEADGTYRIRDYTTYAECTVSRAVAHFLKRLDGRTNPYSIQTELSRREVRQQLTQLDELEFARRGRVLRCSKDNFLFSVLIFKKIRTKSMVPVLLNYLLLIASVPVFLLGMHCCATYFPELEHGSTLWGMLLGLAVGMILHECAHATATYCYRGRVFEMGLGFVKFFPCAYVLTDDTPIKGRLKRAQALAAGPEMNLLLAGITMPLSVYVPSQSKLFFAFAMTNAVLGLLNLSLVGGGLDGVQIMGEFLGCKAVASTAKHTLTHRKAFVRQLKAGPHGVAELLVCCLMMALQFAFYATNILLLLEAISWLF